VSRGVVVAVVLTYLVMSFMPSLSLMSVLGKGKGKG
jgi:hypothetical protein